MLEGKLSSAVVKIHSLPGDSAREESKLTLLGKHEGSMRIPRVYARLSPGLMREIEYIIDQYRFVFTDTVAEPVLIHGDFNLWNILIDPESFKPLALIDPGDSCWGDRESELFQLQNAGGDRFNLLDIYRRNIPLSSLFEIKNIFYWFWDDIKHYIRTGRINEERPLRLAREIRERMIDIG